jgi:hypothetical protein
MKWRGRVLEVLVIVIAVAITARVVWSLLAPLLPALLVLTAVGGVIFGLMRGPHAHR